MTKSKRIAAAILQGLPLAMVTMSGIMKLIGNAELVDGMTKGGYGPFIQLFGIIELVSVGLVLFKPTYKTGFLLLCCYLGGALAVEIAAGKFPTAALLLTLLWIGMFLRDQTIFRTTETKA